MRDGSAGERPRGPRRPERAPPRARAHGARSRPTAWSGATRAILRVEILALVRDRRALFAAFLLPVLLYPLLFLGNSWLARMSAQTLESRNVRLAIDLTQAPPEEGARLAQRLAAELPIEIEELDAALLRASWDWASAPADNETARELARATLETGVDALLVALPAERPGQWSLVTWFDGGGDLGNEARRRVLAASGEVAAELAGERRLLVLGLDPALGLELAAIDVASEADAGGARLGRWLPLLAVFVLLAGASHAALSAFAGEREAGTLETLLVQPVAGSSVVAAKYAAVLGAGLLALFLNAGSVIACLALGLGSLPGLEAGHGLALDAGRILVAALLFLPAAVLLAALLARIASRARTFREGQHLLFPLLLACVLPTLVALSPEIELDATLAAVPLAGPALAVRDVLRGSASAPVVLWMFAASSGWAALALWRLFHALDAERLLQHAQNEAEAHLRRTRSRSALRWALLVVFAVYLVGGWLQSLHAAWGLAATLWLILPLAAWLSARASARRAGWSLAATLQLGPPRLAHALGAILLAPAAAQVARIVFEWQKAVLPMPASFGETALPLELGELSFPAQVILLALSPAICEELFFRGALLGGLRGELARWRIVLWQALFFGAVHASIHRFAPTALLGAVLTLVALRTRSLWPAVLLHAAYNGLLLASERIEALNDPRLAGLALVGAALLAFPHVGRRGSNP